jgi:hypothetical protein
MALFVTESMVLFQIRDLPSAQKACLPAFLLLDNGTPRHVSGHTVSSTTPVSPSLIFHKAICGLVDEARRERTVLFLWQFFLERQTEKNAGQ